MIRDVDRAWMTVAAAAGLPALERRKVFGLLKAFRLEGAPALISKRRGRPSNRRKPETVRYTALALVRERYADFGPTLAAEKLAELHGITLGRETLRGWMIKAGLWVGRAERKRRLHQPRYRRDCPGELVQIDGSEHRWFEDRGPACTLLVFVDDATSRIMHLHFVHTESTFAYSDAALGYHHARDVERSYRADPALVHEAAGGPSAAQSKPSGWRRSFGSPLPPAPRRSSSAGAT